MIFKIYRSATVLPEPTLFQNSLQLPGLSSIESEPLYPNDHISKSMPCLDEIQRCPHLPGLSSVAMMGTSSSSYDEPFPELDEPQTKSMSLPSFEAKSTRLDLSYPKLSTETAPQTNPFMGPETKSIPFGPFSGPADDEFVGEKCKFSSYQTSEKRS